MKYLSKTITLTGLVFFALLTPFPALASGLSLSPSTGTFNRSCNFSLDINLDTAGAQVAATDAYLIYDNSRFTGLSITPGTIFSEFAGNNIDDASGRITISGLAAVSSSFTGQGKLATVNFTVKDNAPAGATQIKFDFDSNDMSKTNDSNVIQKDPVQETLNSVVNGNYTVGTGACGTTPTAAPVVKSPPTGGPGSISTPAAEPKQFKTIDQVAGGSPGGGTQWTAVLAIVGSALTILGILGLALL